MLHIYLYYLRLFLTVTKRESYFVDNLCRLFLIVFLTYWKLWYFCSLSTIHFLPIFPPTSYLVYYCVSHLPNQPTWAIHMTLIRIRVPLPNHHHNASIQRRIHVLFSIYAFVYFKIINHTKSTIPRITYVKFVIYSGLVYCE